MIPVWARPRAIQRINAQFLQALMWIFTSHPDSSYPFFVGIACTLDMALLATHARSYRNPFFAEKICTLGSESKQKCLTYLVR